MTMHAALNRGSTENSGEAFFFVEMPDVGREPLALPTATVTSSNYGERSGPNWIAIAVILALHVAALIALVKLDIITVQKPKAHNLVVFDLTEPAPPPVDRTEPKKVVEKVEAQVVTPVAIVQPVAPPPPPVQVTNTPPPSRPVVAAPAPPPSGPVAVTNLDERLIAGSPPKYPIESRRKKEQGTVVLRLIIGSDGRIQDISIAQSSGFDRLDKAALGAVRNWRWQPVLQNGVAVVVRGLLPIPFVLAEKA